VGDGRTGAVIANACVAAGQDRVTPALKDQLLAILTPAAALGDHRDRYLREWAILGSNQ
jgi:hypothetical protein